MLSKALTTILHMLIWFLALQLTLRWSIVTSSMTLLLSTVVHLTCCRIARRTDLRSISKVHHNYTNIFLILNHNHQVIGKFIDFNGILVRVRRTGC